MGENIKKIWETIKKENEMKIEDEKEIEKIKRIQEERYKKLDGKLIFAIVKVIRRLGYDGKHEREIIVDSGIYQKYSDFIFALNSSELIDNKKDRICKYFDTIEEAEEFVKEVIKNIKQNLERIKKEYEKEKQYNELEEILLY